MNIVNITNTKNLIIKEKLYTHPFSPVVSFMLLAEKFHEIFPKQKTYFFISESFTLNWHMFVELRNKETLAPMIMQA